MADSPLVLGIDSSTQSTKAVLVDASDGRVVAQQRAAHPSGTAVDPRAWLSALDEATAGLIDQAQAVAVGGQQHGMVALDEQGEPVHDALLWNDVRSAGAAADLVEELGGPDACAELTGSVFNASYTITKLRWMRDHEPDAVARIHDVMLPHDYVTWQLAARTAEPTTDRGDASGTGYWSPTDDAYLTDLLTEALGREVRLPRIAAAREEVGRHGDGGASAPARRQHGRGAGARPPQRRRRCLDRYVGRRLDGDQRPDRRRHRRHLRASPTRRDASCLSPARSTPLASSSSAPTCSAWTTTAWPSWPSSPSRAPTA